MSYIESTLIPNEEIKYTGKLHWIIYIKSIAILIVGIILSFSSETRLFGAGVILLSFLFYFKYWLDSITTELAITSKRIIAKVGIIRRETIELNHSKVESLSVDQSILGRILNYGTITINGTGNAKLPIKTISKPMLFRQNANIEFNS